MSDRVNGGDRQYFRRLEDLFISLRGAPLLLSPADWEVARRWREAGIPLDLIESVLREIFERSPKKAGRGGVRSLKYFDRPVTAAWEESLELGAAEGDRTAREIDVPSRLAMLAASLPERPDELRQIGQQIRALSGSAQQVEAGLAGIDAEMLRISLASLSKSEAAALEEGVERALARLDPRLDSREVTRLRDGLRMRQLRRLKSLPLLSLFSPDALRAR